MGFRLVTSIVLDPLSGSSEGVSIYITNGDHMTVVAPPEATQMRVASTTDADHTKSNLFVCVDGLCLVLDVITPIAAAATVDFAVSFKNTRRLTLIARFLSELAGNIPQVLLSTLCKYG